MSDAYVILCIETTYDEYSAYSSKDSAEIVELAWIIIDSKTLEKVRIYLDLNLTLSTSNFSSFLDLRKEHPRSAT